MKTNVSENKIKDRCVMDNLTFQVIGTIVAYITIVTDSGSKDTDYCNQLNIFSTVNMTQNVTTGFVMQQEVV